MLRKFCYGLAALMTTAITAVAQPADDLCENATPLTENVSTSFNTAGATNTQSDVNPVGCDNATVNDVWFSYAPSATGITKVSVTMSTSVPRISVYNTCGGGGSQLACIVPNSTTSVVSFTVTINQIVYIRVSPFDNTEISGVATIKVFAPAPAVANDECANAINISAGQTLVFSNSSATSSALSGCGASLTTNWDVWYRYLPTQTGTAVFTTCGSEVPFVLAAYNNDTCANSGRVCAADFASCEPPLHSELLIVPVTAGIPLRVRVSGRNGATGTGQLHVDFEASPPPLTNDLCTSATPLAANTPTTFDTSEATNTLSDVNPTCLSASRAAAHDVWFSYLASATGIIAVTAKPNPANYRPNVSIYSDCGGGGNLLGCVRASSLGGSAHAVVPVTIGQIVYIRVGSDDNTARTGTIEIAGPSAVPVNDDCVNAINIGGGQTITFDNTFAANSSIPPTNNSDVWYRFAPNQDGLVIFSTCGSQTLLNLELYSDSCTFIAGSISNECGNATSGSFTALYITAGDAARVRVYSANGQIGLGQLSADFQPMPRPANDLCANAVDIGAGNTHFSLVGATTDVSLLCVYNSWGSSTSSDVWYRYTPTVTGYADIGLTQWIDRTGNDRPGLAVFSSCGGQQLFCQSQRARVGVTAGQAILVRVNMASDSVMNVDGTFNITEHGVEEAQYFEGNTDLAGELLGSAVDLSSRNGLSQILGTLQVDDKVDMYKIHICQPTTFSAIAVTNDPFGRTPTVLPKLYLFNEPGQGVVATSSFLGPSITSGVVTPGVYYLAVSSYAYIPVSDDILFLWDNVDQANQSPVNGGVLSEWLRDQGRANPNVTNTYVITLTGLCACAADFNNINGVTVQDIFDFLTAWLAGSPSADFNHVNGVTVQDIFDFLTAWLAGC